jgi:hypothetical protein
VLSLKVTLRNTKPPIWRWILMPKSMTLADLHLAIQTAMGWYSCHLHDFDVDGRRYGDPSDTDDWDDEALADESRLRLSALAGSGVTRFLYTYDFGDRWQHDILIEKASPAGVMKARPACTAGKRNCPPEDCGGPWGYDELIEVLANPPIRDMTNSLSGSAMSSSRIRFRSRTPMPHSPRHSSERSRRQPESPYRQE